MIHGHYVPGSFESLELVVGHRAAVPHQQVSSEAELSTGNKSPILVLINYDIKYGQEDLIR